MSWTRRELFRSFFRPEGLGEGGAVVPTRVRARAPGDADWRKLLDGAAVGPYARGKEGLLVRHFFRDRRGGVFVDAGCHLPEERSGTCFLERHLGWSGVAIDGQDFSQPWRESRRRSRFVQAMLGEASNGPGTTLDRVLEEAEVRAFEFLSISVSAGDLLVLKGLDLNRYRPELIKIHCGPGQRVPTIEHLRGFGYRLLLDYRPYDKIHRYFAPEP